MCVSALPLFPTLKTEWKERSANLGTIALLEQQKWFLVNLVNLSLVRDPPTAKSVPPVISVKVHKMMQALVPLTQKSAPRDLSVQLAALLTQNAQMVA